MSRRRRASSRKTSSLTCRAWQRESAQRSRGRLHPRSRSLFMKLHRPVVFVALLLGACTTEKIQYVTRPPFNQPPDAASGFLGYFTVSDKQTTCGNCHVGQQADWVQTLHANVRDTAYHDVQCESCHGPGFDHVQNPSIKANRPIASAMVYPNVSTNAAVLTAADTAAMVNSSCGSCHQGAGPSQNHNYLAV